MRSIIIDTDPGLDDSIALIAAYKTQKIRVVGITTVVGNACVENTSRNALNLLDELGWDIPVVVGSCKPLIRERKMSSEKSGIGLVKLQKSKKEFLDIDVCDYIYEEAKKHNGDLEILCLAPMTNIAKTIMKYPEIKTMIKAITFMGGTTGKGNITPFAEFNLYVDPHAAEIVFNSGIPLTMVNLDVTKRAFLGTEYIDYFKSVNTIHSNLISEFLQSTFNRDCICGEKNIEVHDVLAFATLVLPDLVKKRKFKVSIETNNKESLGMILLDYRNICEEEKNMDISIDVDEEMFKDWIKTLAY